MLTLCLLVVWKCSTQYHSFHWSATVTQYQPRISCKLFLSAQQWDCKPLILAGKWWSLCLQSKQESLNFSGNAKQPAVHVNYCRTTNEQQHWNSMHISFRANYKYKLQQWNSHMQWEGYSTNSRYIDDFSMHMANNEFSWAQGIVYVFLVCKQTHCYHHLIWMDTPHQEGPQLFCHGLNHHRLIWPILTQTCTLW